MSDQTTPNKITVLPAEIQELSTKVEASKQEEVKQILNEIFTQTANWTAEIEAIQVQSTEDKELMEKARQIRLEVKNARLEAEKRFDAKRAEVQIKMVDFKTEDTLWLKAKQSMQAITQGIEKKAKWQEEFAERFETEQKLAKTQTRLAEMREFKPETLESDVADLSDEMFNTLLAGVKKAHEDKIEADRLAKIEQDKLKEKQDRFNLRRDLAFPYGHFFELSLTTDPSEEIFQKALTLAKEKFEADKIKRDQLQADLDKANKEKADRAKQDEIDRIAKENEDKRKKQEQEDEAKKIQDDLDLAKKAEKNKKFKEWLTKNNYNEATDSWKQNGNEFTLIRIISKIVI